MHRRLFLLSAICCSCLSASVAFAAIEYDQNVTSNAIWGGGNSNGGFTTDRANGIELGLRAHVRYPSASDNAAGIKSNGAGTYGSFEAAGYGAGNTRASWNLDWSINSNYDSFGDVLSSYIYVLERDYDPGYGVNFVQPAYGFSDPINGPSLADHSFGTNATAQSAGIEAANSGDFMSYRDTLTLAQNSSNMAFEDVGGLFDPTADGRYTFRLSAYDRTSGDLLAQTMINVIVGEGAVPEATSFLTWAGIASCVGLIRRRVA